MSIRCPSVPPLDMFALRIQEARDSIVQCNQKLKNPSEFFTQGGLEAITLEITNRLTDIQFQFDKLVCDNAMLLRSSEVSETFALKKGSFEEVKTAGSSLLRKIQLLKEAVMIDLFAPQEINQSSSFRAESEILPPRAPEFSAVHGTSSGGLPALYRTRSSSLDLPDESSALSFRSYGAPPNPSLAFTPLLFAAASIGNLPDSFVLGGESSDSVSTDERSVNIRSEGKRKRQDPVSVESPLHLALQALKPSVAAKPKKHRTALALQKHKDPLLLILVSSLNEKEIGQILTRLEGMLKDIPEDLRVLTPNEVVKFQEAYGSEEYVRYTELQELKKLGNYSVQVGIIERKITRALQGTR